MKKVLSFLATAVLLTGLIVTAVLLIGTVLTGCKQERPVSNTEEVKVNIRIVGIDSTSGARTEDKVLFVNVK
jgi:hypothetical protein